MGIHVDMEAHASRCDPNLARGPERKRQSHSTSWKPAAPSQEPFQTGKAWLRRAIQQFQNNLPQLGDGDDCSGRGGSCEAGCVGCENLGRKPPTPLVTCFAGQAKHFARST